MTGVPTGVSGQTYIFQLTVTDTGGLSSRARTTVTIGSPAQVRIIRFDATPNSIQVGQSSQLTWIVEGADNITIQPTSVAETLMGLASIAITVNFGAFTLNPEPSLPGWISISP